MQISIPLKYSKKGGKFGLMPRELQEFWKIKIKKKFKIADACFEEKERESMSGNKLFLVDKAIY